VGGTFTVLRRGAVTPQEIIDISVGLGVNTPPWPGDTPYSCGWAWDMAAGASVNVGRVETSLHVGTHADAPLHVMQDGSASDALPLDAFRGEAMVIDVSTAQHDAQLSRQEIASHCGSAGVPRRLLLRTGRSVSFGEFPASWPTLSEEAVRWLTAGGLRLLGTDAPSVDPRTATDLTVHRTLFTNAAYLIENLDLRRVTAGRYQLIAYPVLVHGADAAPVRAVLEPLPR
jgi:arylformamidase